MIILTSIFSILLCKTLSQIIQIIDDNKLTTNLVPLSILVDPPSGHLSPTGLGLFARASDINATIFYTIAWSVQGSTDVMPIQPTWNKATKMNGINNGIVTGTNTYAIGYNTPYIQITTPYGMGRNVAVVMIAIGYSQQHLEYYRSGLKTLYYFVEAAGRAYSYGFLVPGPESKGQFISVALEVAAVARAQAAGSQEYADFFSYLGSGIIIFIGKYIIIIKVLIESKLRQLTYYHYFQIQQV